VIPLLEGQPPHLPPGRYRATLGEVLERFVEGMPTSSTRGQIWQGFMSYLDAWGATEDQLRQFLDGAPLVRVAWLAGSFISGKINPNNIDLSLIIDGDSVDLCRGKPGAKRIKELAYRDGMLKRFKVSPCIVPYRFFRSPFRLQNLGPTPELDYVVNRGAFDDFWQRARPYEEPKCEPSRDSAQWRRGYLEVAL
jgi:hypothetical protein